MALQHLGFEQSCSAFFFSRRLLHIKFHQCSFMCFTMHIAHYYFARVSALMLFAYAKEVHKIRVFYCERLI